MKEKRQQKKKWRPKKERPRLFESHLTRPAGKGILSTGERIRRPDEPEEPEPTDARRGDA